MNKATKGAIAAGAAAVLLLGGLGSYALWSDEETLGGGTVTAGELSLEAVGTPTWQDVSTDVPGNPKAITVSTFKIVPGDTIQYDATFKIKASGDNLKADLSADTTAISGGLSSLLTTQVTATSGTVTLPTTGAKTRITSANQDVTVSVKITLPGSINNQVGQNLTADLSGFKLKLEQART